MLTRRRVVIALGASALAAPFATFAQQQTAKAIRIGFLGPASASETAGRLEALRLGLRDLGYVEGKNIVVEFHWADGKYDRLLDLAAELVRLKVDVIVTYGTAGTQAAKRATTVIPIVMITSGDAIATGLVASLARPGGNITGSTIFNPELSAKRIELIKEAMPRITKVAVLLNPDNPVNGSVLHAMEITARSLKVELHQFEARRPDEVDGTFAAMVKKRFEAVVLPEDPIFNANIKWMAEIAVKRRLLLAGGTEVAEAGGVIGYGVNFLELWRRAAVFMDKILKGAKPGDIPIERATKFEMVVNMKTAKAFGLKIPNTILVLATKVIE